MATSSPPSYHTPGIAVHYEPRPRHGRRKMMPKIDRSLPLRDAIKVVAEGHFQLHALLLGISQNGIPGETTDTPTRTVLYLDDFDVRGELAWRLYEDVCRSNLWLLVRVLLAVSFNALTPAGLRIGIEEGLLDVDALARSSQKVERFLSRHSRELARSLPAAPSVLVPAGQEEFYNVLTSFFSTPPAAAGYDEENECP